MMLNEALTSPATSWETTDRQNSAVVVGSHGQSLQHEARASGQSEHDGATAVLHQHEHKDHLPNHNRAPLTLLGCAAPSSAQDAEWPPTENAGNDTSDSAPTHLNLAAQEATDSSVREVEAAMEIDDAATSDQDARNGARTPPAGSDRAQTVILDAHSAAYDDELEYAEIAGPSHTRAPSTSGTDALPPSTNNLEEGGERPGFLGQSNANADGPDIASTADTTAAPRAAPKKRAPQGSTSAPPKVVRKSARVPLIAILARNKLPIIPAGPRHLEAAYTRAHVEFRGETYRVCWDLGWRPKPKGIAFWEVEKRPTAEEVKARRDPAWMAAARRLNEAARMLDEALARGETWETVEYDEEGYPLPVAVAESSTAAGTRDAKTKTAAAKTKAAAAKGTATKRKRGANDVAGEEEENLEAIDAPKTTANGNKKGARKGKATAAGEAKAKALDKGKGKAVDVSADNDHEPSGARPPKRRRMEKVVEESTDDVAMVDETVKMRLTITIPGRKSATTTDASTTTPITASDVAASEEEKVKIRISKAQMERLGSSATPPPLATETNARTLRPRHKKAAGKN